MPRIFPFLLVVLVTATPLWAQADRYELGRRVRDFEITWDTRLEDTAAKKRASPTVNKAVQSFFSLNFSGAAKALDEARQLLISDKPAGPDLRWADALCVWPETRLTESAKLQVVVRPYYKTDGPMPSKWAIRISLDNELLTETALAEFPQIIDLKLPSLSKDHDGILKSEVLVDGKVFSTKQCGFSRIMQLSKRLEALNALDKAQCPPDTIERKTLEHHLKILTDLSKSTILETDYPAARLIAEAEQLYASKEPLFNAKAERRELWLSLPTPKTASVVRVGLPKELSKPTPVVVALHGMGGSENMFFDAYGNGVIPRMAVERGWIVVGTRSGGVLGAGPSPNVNAILDELGKRYPIDRTKVFLVGHSMGAGHVTQLASQTPEKYTGVACLGGGRGMGKAEQVKILPFFVGCGTADFALSGARALHASLEKMSGKSSFKTYEDIEHLAIVREAANDVYRFFDGLAAATKK